MVHCLTDGIWFLVFGGILLLSGTVNRVSSRRYSSNLNDDNSGDDSDGSDDTQRGSGDSTVKALSTVATSPHLTEGFENIQQSTGHSVIIAVVGCTAFLTIVIIAAVVAVVIIRKRKSLPFVSGGKASTENHYEVRRPPESRQLQSDEDRYTSLSIEASIQPSSPPNESPIYEDVKLP